MCLSLCDVKGESGTRELLLHPRVQRWAAEGPGSSTFPRTPLRLESLKESDVKHPNKWLLISSRAICKKDSKIIYCLRAAEQMVKVTKIRTPMGNLMVIFHCQYISSPPPESCANFQGIIEATY